MDKLQGKLIAFEGIDGSGKTTQVELLREYLASQGPTLQVEVISFPQYGKNEYAEKITRYLSGRLNNIDPYELAKVYALDRKTVREQILDWLESKKLVIANRYVSSSKAHMGANLDEEKRGEFMKWLDELEYQTNGMPRPNLTILLDVDPKIGQQNALKDHLVDMHEESIEHEEEASKIFLELSRIEENWVVVNCMEDDKMSPEEKIHREILKVWEKYKQEFKLD